MILVQTVMALPGRSTFAHHRNVAHSSVRTYLAAWILALVAVNSYCPPVAKLRLVSLTSAKKASIVGTKRMSICLNIENESSRHHTFDFGCANFAGTDPDRPQKVNQDGSFFLPSCDVGNGKCITLFGVMDGHGLKGHILVKYLQQNLPLCLVEYLRSALLDHIPPTQEPVANEETTNSTASTDASYLRLQQDVLEQVKQDLIEYGNADSTELYVQQESLNPSLPKNDLRIRQAIVDAYLSVQYQASQNPNVPSSRSGTTCICCVLIQEHDSLHLYTATVGDSRAILFSKSEATPGAGKVQALTEATTVKIATERNRIMSCQSRIDASGNVFYGPIGIAMTRSLGNTVMLQAGILPIPIVTMETLSDSSGNTHYYVCAGTDGVFDVLSNEHVVNIIAESVVDLLDDRNIEMPLKSGQDIANDVCNQARLAWLDDLPIEPKVDDITFAMLDVFLRRKTCQN